MNMERKKREFTKTLFEWHKEHYRDMPWRRTRDPYRILISEVMLQQTQVDRVRTKYAEFLRAFPTARALAAAPLGDVLRIWSGLGYNRRAKYLHECAKRVILEHKGKFPRGFDELRALPGIGISTAAAVRAFAYGEGEPMIDTNIRRILARVFYASHCQGVTLTVGGGMPSDKDLYTFAKSLIPEGEGRMWNYAMLDLGAMVCTARNHSDACQLLDLHGEVGDFVYKKPQKKFAGSRRFFRGRVLAALSEKPNGMMMAELLTRLEECGADNGLATSIVNDLISEGLVALWRGKITLPS